MGSKTGEGGNGDITKFWVWDGSHLTLYLFRVMARVGLGHYLLLRIGHL